MQKKYAGGREKLNRRYPFRYCYIRGYWDTFFQLKVYERGSFSNKNVYKRLRGWTLEWSLLSNYLDKVMSVTLILRYLSSPCGCNCVLRIVFVANQTGFVNA